MINESVPTCIDLFCGAGGLTHGLKKAGWRSVFGLDANRAASETFRHNFPDTPYYNSDIRGFDFSPYQGKIDLVAGGPPCQPFSVAGNQKSNKDERDMFPEFIRVLKEVDPPNFILENVPGLKSNRHSWYFESLLGELATLGYNINYSVVDAADYGVPQHRKRLIVVGMKYNKFVFPSPTHGPLANKPYFTAGEALQSVPSDEPNRAIITYAKRPILRPSSFAGMLVNGGGRPINLSRPSQTIPASAGGNRTHIYDPEGVLVDYHTRLLVGEEPRKGCVKDIRRITVRESARLQSFPDDFEFLGGKSSQYTQVGNAVPPVLAKMIATEVLNAYIQQEEVKTVYAS